MPISLTPQPDAASVEFARRHATVTLSPLRDAPGLPPGGDVAGGGFAGGGFAAYLASVMQGGGSARDAGDVSRASEPSDDASGRAFRKVSGETAKEPEPTDASAERSRADEALREADRAGEDAAERSAGARASEKRAAHDREQAAESANKESDAASAELAERSRRAERDSTDKSESAKRPADDVDAGEDAAKELVAGAGDEASGAMKAAVGADLARARADDGEQPSVRRRVTKSDGRTSVEIDVLVDKEPVGDGSGDGEAKAAVGTGDRVADAPATDGPGEAARSAGDAARARETIRSERARGDVDGTKSDLRAEVAGQERGAARRDDATREARDEGGERAGRRVEVRDLRARANDSGGGSDGGADARRDNEASSATLRSQTSQAGGTTGDDSASGREGTSSFEALRADADSATGRTGRSAASPTRMTTATAELRRAFNEQLNGEIVRSARLVVRGGERGEIRLNLKPETLGSVRIALQMQDGHIAGRIIVDNQSVREAFEQNLAALQKAFAESGMDASGLEVTVADSGRDSGQTDDGLPGKQSSGAAAATFDNAVPTVNSIEERHDLVDLIV